MGRLGITLSRDPERCGVLLCRVPHSSDAVPEILLLFSLLFRLIIVLFRCKCGWDGHCTLVSTFISTALSFPTQGNQPASKISDTWGWSEGPRFWSQDDSPLILSSATCQLYDLGKFLNILELQLLHCKWGSRLPLLQH